MSLLRELDGIDPFASSSARAATMRRGAATAFAYEAEDDPVLGKGETHHK